MVRLQSRSILVAMSYAACSSGVAGLGVRMDDGRACPDASSLYKSMRGRGPWSMPPHLQQTLARPRLLPLRLSYSVRSVASSLRNSIIVDGRYRRRRDSLDTGSRAALSLFIVLQAFFFSPIKSKALLQSRSPSPLFRSTGLNGRLASSIDLDQFSSRIIV